MGEDDRSLLLLEAQDLVDQRGLQLPLRFRHQIADLLVYGRRGGGHRRRVLERLDMRGFRSHLSYNTSRVTVAGFAGLACS